MITLSLIYLHTCLEAIRTIPECTSLRTHGACKPTREECIVQCISDLETHLKMFLTELSRVFFKKDNLKNKNWWLSAFYSFCIQSIIRRALIQLTERQEHISLDTRWTEPRWIEQRWALKQYLYLPLRLFIATSGTLDPLTEKYPFGSHIKPEDSELAKQAVKHDRWKSNGISGSLQYLQTLFEDKGEALPEMRNSLSPPGSPGARQIDFAFFFCITSIV